MTSRKVCVIGGGPAGIMAAYAASITGKEVVLIEKNEKIGKKLYITGKGRCNITNSASIDGFIEKTMRNSKFLFSALNTFNNSDLKDLLELNGLFLKEERGGRMFPVSDKSNDVNKTFEKILNSQKIDVWLNTQVKDINLNNDGSISVNVRNKTHVFDSVIIATGGASYPLTGSTGDGYFFAQSLGHTVTKRYPSLIPLTSSDEFISDLSGVSLKNVGFSLLQNGKSIFNDLGEILFTHFGLSGPLVLTASASINFNKPLNMLSVIDLKPGLDEAKLDKRILRDFEENKNKNIENALFSLIIRRLIPVVLQQSGINKDKKVNEITVAERKGLVRAIKGITVNINGTRPLEEAIITRGGVSTKEIDASTMKSKLAPGLLFAGEVIDVDALTGGYNLQIAFSTGYVAGLNS